MLLHDVASYTNIAMKTFCYNFGVYTFCFVVQTRTSETNPSFESVQYSVLDEQSQDVPMHLLPPVTPVVYSEIEKTHQVRFVQTIGSLNLPCFTLNVTYIALLLEGEMNSKN